MSSADTIKILKAFFLRALLFPKKNAFPISKVTELAAMTQEPWGKIRIISILFAIIYSQDKMLALKIFHEQEAA